MSERATNDVWEYKYAEITLKDDEDPVPLNKLGADGWQLVAVTVIGLDHYAWLRRQIRF